MKIFNLLLKAKTQPNRNILYLKSIVNNKFNEYFQGFKSETFNFDTHY